MPKYDTGHLSREWDELSGIHEAYLICGVGPYFLRTEYMYIEYICM